MKMIAGRCLRASANSRRMRAAPRPANISTNDGGRLREELGAGLVGDGLGQQRLAGAGRAVQQDALGHRGAELAEALRVAQEVDDLLQLGLGLVGAGDLVPADRADGVRLDLLRLRLRHQLQRPPQEEDDEAHEDHGPPRQDVVLRSCPRSSSGAVSLAVAAGGLEAGVWTPFFDAEDLGERGAADLELALVGLARADQRAAARSPGRLSARGDRRVGVALASRRRPRPRPPSTPATIAAAGERRSGARAPA